MSQYLLPGQRPGTKPPAMAGCCAGCARGKGCGGGAALGEYVTPTRAGIGTVLILGLGLYFLTR